MTYKVNHASNHIARCNAAVKYSPDSLFRTIMLANGSILIHSKKFFQDIAPRMFDDFLETGGDVEKTSAKLWNFAAMKFKQNCIDYAWKNKDLIHEVFCMSDEKEFYFWLNANVPGLGIAKAAFVSQMANGYLGCIDSVNTKRLGVGRTQSPNVYVNWFENGTISESSQEMWHAWCTFVAERDSIDAYKLSEAHALFIENGSYKPQSL